MNEDEQQPLSEIAYIFQQACSLPEVSIAGVVF